MSIENEYRDDEGPEGMQAELAKGTAADRVQGVLADEARVSNTHLVTQIETMKDLIISIDKLVKSIAVLVSVIGIAVIYMVLKT